MTKSNACAKIILFGEHAVVFGKPGIAIPVLDLKTNVEINSSDEFSYDTSFQLNFDQRKKVDELFELLFEKLNIELNINVKINSNIPIASGLGSSAALTIAIIRGLNNHFNLDLLVDNINELAYECEKIFHGTPSGIDNSVICYEKPVYFQKGKEIEFIEPGCNMQFVIIDSEERSSTKDVVMDVKKNYDINPSYKIIINEIEKLVINAKKQFIQGKLDILGDLMDRNHMFLKELNVSNDKLNDLVRKSRINGYSYGSKLAGAGRGGNIISLAKDSIKLKEQMDEFSNSVIITTLNK